MTHPEMDELYELFVLGALDRDEATAIEQHLADNCEYCAEHVRNAFLVAAAISGTAEEAKPPARLRKRILASIAPETSTAPEKKAKSTGWLPAIWGLSAACVALLGVVLWINSSLQQSKVAIAQLQTERTQLREAVQILSQRDTRTVQFGRAATQPYGRVFVNTNRGLVFVSSQLPALAANRTFQLWLIPGQGAPESAGVFTRNAAGNAVQVRTAPIDTSRITAVAVSVEPQGGSAAPTTTPILIVPLA